MGEQEGPVTGPEGQQGGGNGQGGTPPPGTAPEAPEGLSEGGKRALEAERTAKREAEKRAKELEKRLADLENANKSEAERAIAEAEKRGRDAAISSVGVRLVRSEITAAAAKRNSAFEIAPILDDLNLSKFLSEDGEPNTAEIEKAIERLVPEPASNPRPGGNVYTGPRDNGNGERPNTPQGWIERGLLDTLGNNSR